MAVRRVYQTVFERSGFVCETAQDGREALRMAIRAPYHLIVMDMNMPNWDGIDAIVSLSIVHPDQKIVVVSGRLEDDLLGRLKDEPQVLRCLDKPVRPRELVEIAHMVRADINRDSPTIRS